ncbi:MAG: hypothetical protein M3N53_12900 [Actinomycetota bacterium]|nr:hypothetical protein [Actinomycetota bacterium]
MARTRTNLDGSLPHTATKVHGLDGADTLKGNELNNRICGGDAEDTLYGYAGGDYIAGKGARDVIYAGWGADWIWDGAGSDVIWGGDGSDVLYSCESNAHQVNEIHDVESVYTRESYCREDKPLW